MRRSLLPFLSIVGLLLPAVAGAQKVPLGSQFQVNTYTTGYAGQRAAAYDCWYGRGGQSVAADGSGNFVVVWQNYSFPLGQDGSHGGVVGQRFDSTGTRLGAEFIVNSYTTGSQIKPDVAAGTAGNFVVVWVSYGQGSTYSYNTHIFGQRYDSAGSRVGSEFQVSSPDDPDAYDSNPRITSDPSGNFVVVWGEGSESISCRDPRDVFARRYSSTGASLGGEFQVNAGTSGIYSSGFPDVAADADGDFVVVWEEFLFSAPYGRHIYGRRYDSAGTAQGGQFDVAPAAYAGNLPSVAAHPAGDFVVAWQTYELDCCGYPDIAARRFDSSGTALGNAFRVNSTFTTGYIWHAAVDTTPGGGFVVTWDSEAYYSTYPYGGLGYLVVLAQQYDSAGAPLGGDLQVNDDNSYWGAQNTPAVAVGPSGDFMVVWTSDVGTSDKVFGRFLGDFPPCTAVPRNTCREQTVSRRGAFRFREPTSPKRKNLVWRWPKGEATAVEDFGDPFTSTDYTLCVYDESMSSQPVIRAQAPAGGTCGAFNCWLALGGQGQTIQYFDTFGDPEGVRRIRLRAGDDGKARVALTGKGENLALPAEALVPPVTVQLQASNGECFTATYDALIRKNEPGKFVGRPGSPSGAFLDARAAALD